MMVQNAAFMPDPLPAAPTRFAAGAAPAPAGTGFQQLLQGREPAAPNPAAQGSGEAPAGKTAAKGEPTTRSAPRQRAAASRDGEADRARTAEDKGAEKRPAEETAPKAEAAKQEKKGPASGKGADAEAAEPGSGDLVRSADANGLVPDPNPGLVVAAAQLESNLEGRSGGVNAEAGAQALARLEALQRQATAEVRDAVDAQNVRQDQEGKAPKQEGKAVQHQPADVAAGLPLCPKAEPVDPAGAGEGKVLAATGAAEGAQGTKPQVSTAPEDAQGKAHVPELPAAAKTDVPADQAAAVARLAAKETGAGRFLAMPVRNVSGNAEETAAAQAPAGSAADAPQGGAETTATTQGTGGATKEAQAEQAAANGKSLPGEEQAKAKPQQAEPVQGSDDEGSGKVRQHRERLVESATGKEVRGAQHDQPTTTVKPSGDEVSGSKEAATVAKPGPETGAVRDASGSRGEQGDWQHKGQEQQNGTMTGAGVTAQANATGTTQVEAKEGSAKNPLHESILAQVKEGVVTHDGKGNGQMSIRLNPGELGELKIQVRMENQRLHVTVQADNSMVKDLLLSNLDSLKEALSSKNLAMDGFNVSTGGGGFNGPLNEERGNQRQQQSPRFARGAGYDGQEAPRVNYLTSAGEGLLDVRM